MIFIPYFLSGLIFFDSNYFINKANFGCQSNNIIENISQDAISICLCSKNVYLNQLFIRNMLYKPKNQVYIDKFSNLQKFNIDLWSKLSKLINVSHLNLLQYNQTRTSLAYLIDSNYLPETIELLNLNQNKIRTINYMFFIRLKSLKYVFLDSNNLLNIDINIFCRIIKLSVFNNPFGKKVAERLKNNQCEREKNPLILKHDYSPEGIKNKTIYNQIEIFKPMTENSLNNFCETNSFLKRYDLILTSLVTIFVFILFVYFVILSLIKKKNVKILI